MRSLTRFALWLGLGCWYSTAVTAQWSPQMTADLGRGMGQIALSQSVLTDTRRGSGHTQPPESHSAGADGQRAQRWRGAQDLRPLHGGAWLFESQCR